MELSGLEYLAKSYIRIAESALEGTAEAAAAGSWANRRRCWENWSERRGEWGIRI